jgi:hypothetical protein
MEHVMSELNYWTDIMTRWRVGWIACSEHKAHGKMASQLVQPYITLTHCDTIEFTSNKVLVPVLGPLLDFNVNTDLHFQRSPLRCTNNVGSQYRFPFSRVARLRRTCSGQNL